jgi:hypothetical protein
MSKFLKASELQLINGGYVSTDEKAPVTNYEFLAAQKQAAFVVTFARLAKTKNFTSKTPDSLSDLVKEVQNLLNKNDKKIFVETPKTPSFKITDSLKEEASNFISFKKKTEDITKINNYLQRFSIISEFEEFGLFFESGISKLDKIYTISDITVAVTETINLLDA